MSEVLVEKIVEIKTLEEGQLIKFPKNTYHHVASPYFWVDISDRVGKVMWTAEDCIGINLENSICFAELSQENVDLSKHRTPTLPEDFECDLQFGSNEEEYPDSWEDKVLIQIGEQA